MGFFISLLIILIMLMPALYLSLKWRKVEYAVIVKGGLTFLIWLYACVSTFDHLTIYGLLISIGILAGLLGDVAIEKKLINGMVLFLLGHIFYIAAFISNGPFLPQALIVFVILFGLAVGYYKVSRPRLKDYIIPVAIYAMFLLSMLSLGLIQPFDRYFTVSSLFMAFGAILFAASDFLLAQNLFVKDKKIMHLISLYLYYFGQFLLALSI